jgi:hypothetical protein
MAPRTEAPCRLRCQRWRIFEGFHQQTWRFSDGLSVRFNWSHQQQLGKCWDLEASIGDANGYQRGIHQQKRGHIPTTTKIKMGWNGKLGLDYLKKHWKAHVSVGLISNFRVMKSKCHEDLSKPMDPPRSSQSSMRRDPSIWAPFL